ncbi:DNA repair protein RecN [Shewanella sp. 202IG2-18]|uniref:DNA repair protein RecN n=1 Tax=Parashewanella hymeniacidonis TaxID=2807618 RepID=UPI0019605393|nr:DNA repair protein RecN [Parashewanella hymeniacidonis]MBM7071927.1 DNA repair protein RecN [Parashewanella hymeniacidonis]
MLCQLSINNFAIVRFLELDFSKGMTSITGETGAGKSIAIDALGLCLGNRADTHAVRPGANKTEISATFNIDKLPLAKRWLEDQDLHSDEECILRRTITSEGRSRAYINSNPVPLSQLKSIGQLLIAVHGQHAHHAMLKNEHQLDLLDSYANHQGLLNDVEKQYKNVKRIESELKQLFASQEERKARQQLLEYQVQEFDEFDLKENEFEQIEQEHKKLANSTDLISHCQQSLSLLCDSDENIESMLNQASSLAADLESFDPDLKTVGEMLNNALIQIQESSGEIQHYLSNLEQDPEHFEYIEQRLSKTMQLARKHIVAPNELFSHHQSVKTELEQISLDEGKLDDMHLILDSAIDKYQRAAKRLSQSRKRYAKELDKLVTQSIHQLNMPKGKFEIEVNHSEENISNIGGDSIEFLVTTNPGQPLQPISKVASGGELSRIGLGIQVITAQKVSTPTLIFDEVDVGISGPTAAVVGRMLRSLGESTQVFCVTHLPQVAGNGHQHMFVNKKSAKGQTETSMTPLNKEQRIEELARLLAGDTITQSSLANAQELLIH